MSVFCTFHVLYSILSLCKALSVTGDPRSPLRMFTHFRSFSGEQYSHIWHLSPYLHIVIAPFHLCPLHLVIPRDKTLPFGFVDLLVLSRLLFKPATEVDKLRHCHKLRQLFHSLCAHKRLAEIAEP